MRRFFAFLTAAVLAGLCGCGAAAPTQSEPVPSPTQGLEAEGEGELSMSITIETGGTEFSAVLYDNEAARELCELLPLSIEMDELNGNEKYYYLSEKLPTEPSVPSHINAGDLMLYGGSCLVLFYESFNTAYSYTPLGYIQDAEGLADALGRGSVSASIS